MALRLSLLIVVLTALVLSAIAPYDRGVWLAEAARLDTARAWPSTKAAVGAVGLSILIELAAGLLATAVFIGGVLMAAGS